MSLLKVHSWHVLTIVNFSSNFTDNRKKKKEKYSPQQETQDYEVLFIKGAHQFYRKRKATDNKIAYNKLQMWRCPKTDCLGRERETNWLPPNSNNDTSGVDFFLFRQWLLEISGTVDSFYQSKR